MSQSRRLRSGKPSPDDPSLQVLHLQRELKTALELAIVGMAPSDLVERLAAPAGLLDALGELPVDSAPAIALLPKIIERTQAALKDWRTWETQHLHKATA